MPPFVCFFGSVDTLRFPLADNPDAGLDNVTRNSSAVFQVYTKFNSTEAAAAPNLGWCSNYMYCFYAKHKKQWKEKCLRYSSASTPFRQHGRKAYITGNLYGFCNKKVAFRPDIPYNPFEFVPLIEITDLSWAASDMRQAAPATASQAPSASPTKGVTVFDPRAQMSADGFVPSTPTKPSKPLSLIPTLNTHH